jgi:dTDP-4-amino-4,6-dideoxygalactose transaminase
VLSTFHYVPLHSSPGGHRFAAREVACPTTDDVSGRLLRLPFYTHLADADADRVVGEFLGALER